jgi:hypothetical protein
MTEMTKPERKRRIHAAIALIVVGAALFLLQVTRGPAEVIVFLVLGAAFLVGYFRSRAYGLLVAGCILLGLGFGAVGERSSIDFTNFSSFGIGLGFLAIFVIDTMYRGSTHWWPLIPGGILLVMSVGDLRALRLLVRGWPLILVLIGVFLLLRAGRGSREPGPPPTEG